MPNIKTTSINAGALGFYVGNSARMLGGVTASEAMLTCGLLSRSGTKDGTKVTRTAKVVRYKRTSLVDPDTKIENAISVFFPLGVSEDAWFKAVAAGETPKEGLVYVPVGRKTDPAVAATLITGVCPVTVANKIKSSGYSFDNLEAIPIKDLATMIRGSVKRALYSRIPDNEVRTYTPKMPIIKV